MSALSTRPTDSPSTSTGVLASPSSPGLHGRAALAAGAPASSAAVTPTAATIPRVATHWPMGGAVSQRRGHCRPAVSSSRPTGSLGAPPTRSPVRAASCALKCALLGRQLGCGLGAPVVLPPALALGEEPVAGVDDRVLEHGHRRVGDLR